MTKEFDTLSGECYQALRGLNLTAAPGEFCAVLGPMGSGNSTTLSSVSGPKEPIAGEVSARGRPVTGIGCEIGDVFQTDAVFPWKLSMSKSSSS